MPVSTSGRGEKLSRSEADELRRRDFGQSPPPFLTPDNTTFHATRLARRSAPANASTFGRSIGFIYTYHILQCPLEQLHGRQSSLHNAVSGASLGAFGVMQGRIGVPFVPPHVLHGNGPRGAVAIGAAVYGGLGFAFAAMGGKRM